MDIPSHPSRALAVSVACVTFLAAACGVVGAELRSSHRAAGAEEGPDTGVVYSVRTTDPVVFLTIDDGAARSPEMVDVLVDSGISATLFLTDGYVRQDPDFFRRLSERTGSTIQNHTLDHPDLADEPPDEQRRQICATSDSYEREFGHRPALLRPPYGSFDDHTLRAAQECGIDEVVHWSAEVREGRMEFAAGDRLRPGDIVLMHFGEDFAEDVAEFAAQADRVGLSPALLEDYL
ncbi:polysaccharide deacetylase family protein [Nocardiopsis sp. EMB25]|uniref:polysaccharide deacetylase family protein n=1 Tax=Nocardiopsis TaxID=2013 RepID=UPI00036D086E|nr:MULTISPECIES: polysaccharide deacetylase family protein [Nocardiopsis]MCY9782524.1 polysaccharide deacetylase family protein [Nocardiopsis sp. EMB25]